MTSENVVIQSILQADAATSGDPIGMPPGDLQVSVSRYTIARNATLTVHRHRYPRYGYVLRGSLVVTAVESGLESSFKAGDFILEDVMRWHKARNAGAVPVELLVVDFVKPGEANTEARDGG